MNKCSEGNLIEESSVVDGVYAAARREGIGYISYGGKTLEKKYRHEDTVPSITEMPGDMIHEEDQRPKEMIAKRRVARNVNDSIQVMFGKVCTVTAEDGTQRPLADDCEQAEQKS